MVLRKTNPVWCVVIALALSRCGKSETDAGLDTLTTASSFAFLGLFWRGKRQSKKGDETIDC